MTPREARPRSERLRALGIHGSTVSGTASSDYLALKAAFSSHAADSDIHVTTEEKAAWNLVASLFGVDANGDIYPKDNRGFWTNSFLSSHGSDPEAWSGGGLDVSAMWAALAAGTSEQINASHIPELSISKISGLQDALDGKLSGITKAMVEAVLTGTVTSHNHDGMYAPLSGGVIPSQYLPSYVDDVLEYASKSAFPSSGEAGKIYVALDTNLTYRWGGSSYVEISPSLALGHTSSTAYPGNEGAANASAIATLQGYFTGGAANKVAHALTISYDGGAAVKFDGSTALSVTIPSDAQRARWDKICALFDVDENGDVYVTGNRGFWSPTFLSAQGSDPEAGQGGTGGLDIDAMWDALATSGTQKIDASHIPALGLLSGSISNAQLQYSSIGVAGVTVPLGGSVSTAQIASALTAAGHKLTDTTYGLATDSAAGLVKTGYLTQVGTKNYGVKLNSLGQMYVSVPWTDTVTTLASLGITATAAEINKLDGLATTATELGYVHGVTSNIQTQLNAKANASMLAAYALKDGSNASGTWPISVSGSAGRATYLTSTYTGSGGLQPPSYFNGMGLKVNMMSQPSAYCDVIVVNGYGGGGSDVPYINALAFKKSSAAHGDVWHARGDYGGSSWGTWYKFLDECNYATTLDSRYVKKAGDTMSGTLTLLVGGNDYDQGIRINRPTLADWATLTIGCVGSGTSGTSANTWLIGTPANSNSLIFCLNASSDQKCLCLRDMTNMGLRWNGYTVWHAGNDGSGSGLDADMLDGYQVSSLLKRSTFGIASGTTVNVEDYVRSQALLREAGNIYSISGWSWANSAYIKLDGSHSVDIMRYSVLSYRSGNLNMSWNQQALMFLPTYTDNKEIYLVQMYTNDTGGVVEKSVKRYTDYDTILASNVASATKLATARSLWGQSFDGTGNVNGHIYLDSPSHRIFFGTSGVTAYLTGEDSGYFSLKSANNTSYASSLLTINLSNKTVYLPGNVGIGTIAPVSKLDVKGMVSIAPTAGGNWNENIRLHPYNNWTSLVFCGTDNTGATGTSANTWSMHGYLGNFYINRNSSNAHTGYELCNVSGNWGIGTVTPAAKLHVAGTIYSSTGIWSDGYVSAHGVDTTSDRRFKDDIAPLDRRGALAVIRALKPSTWTWNALAKVKGRSAGFVAQDVAGILPDAIRETGEDKHLTLNYQMLHAYEVAALQEHDDEIHRLRRRVAELENKIKNGKWHTGQTS